MPKINTFDKYLTKSQELNLIGLFNLQDNQINLVMRSLICLLILFLLSIVPFSLLAQNFQFPMYFEDAEGNKDTIFLGLDQAASEGIDTDMQEENIINEAYVDGLDVRLSDEWWKSLNEETSTFHTKRQIISDTFTILVVDIVTDHFPVEATWDSSLFAESLDGTLITSINPGGWWDTGSPSDMGRVMLADQNSIIFTSNANINVFNPNYSYQKEEMVIPVYWFLFDRGSPINAVETIESEQIDISPNPTHGMITLSGLDAQNISSLQLLDVQGSHLKTLSIATTVDLSAFPAGMYLLLIKTKKNSTGHIRKIIVK